MPWRWCVVLYRFLQLIRPEDGDEYREHMFCDANTGLFQFIILTQNPAPEEELLRITFAIKVV